MSSIRNPLHVYGDSLEVPYHLHFGKEMLDKMCLYKDHVALINADTGESVTFLEMAQQTVDIALSLTRFGVGRGDVVSICSEKRMEVLPVILATFCAGASYATADITYGEGPLLHRMNIAKPKIMFCSRSAFELHKCTFNVIGSIEKYIVFGEEEVFGATLFKDFITETCPVEDYLPAPVNGTKDIVLILFSSGTTGLPKGVPWTHLGFLVNSVSVTNDSFSNSLMLNTREWYYTYGLFTTIGCLRKGCGVVFSPRNEERDWWMAVQKYKIKILQLAPTTIVEVIKSTILDEYDVSSVCVVYSSSTPVFADQVDGISKRLRNLTSLYQIYGLSEAGSACNEMHAPLGTKPGSVGTPSHGFEFKVVDIDTRKTVGPNVRGEICLKSPSLTPGYIGINNKNHLDEEGFFLTGDVGYYDDDRYFFIINRIKELIKYKDTSIAPAELECILTRHRGVREAGVAGVTRAHVGECPAALVVRQPGEGGTLSEGELLQYVHERVSVNWRLAGGIKFVDKLPRGAGDKLDRNALKLMAERLCDASK